VPITHRKIDGVDESEQLSLSNPMDINRGLATHKIAVAILNEYQLRAKRGNSFAEWYSIDPPYPDAIFGDEKIVGGAYCNGGIMPLVGGELALAAFEHGFEKYGVDILKKYSELTKNNATYLWYFPDGTVSTVENSTSPDALPTDGWGSSAMLMALIEGLIGIKDKGKKFEDIDLSIRLHVADVREADINIKYGTSSANCAYKYSEDDEKLRIEIKSSHKSINAHIHVPKVPSKVLVDGKEYNFTNSKIEQSNYVDFKLRNCYNSKVDVVY
jgi:hypothetical protein